MEFSIFKKIPNTYTYTHTKILGTKNCVGKKMKNTLPSFSFNRKFKKKRIQSCIINIKICIGHSLDDELKFLFFFVFILSQFLLFKFMMLIILLYSQFKVLDLIYYPSRIQHTHTHTLIQQ